MGKFNRMVDNLSRTSAALAEFMDRHGDKLDSSAINFLHASRGLRKLVADNAERVDSAMIRWDRASAGLETVVNRLDTLARASRRLSQALESEDGTLQLLLEDRRLYDDLRKTADALDDLIADIRANPRKYINLKVEIF
jgi:phospholipid/cholesterol/gamma-HCH transport system substrate-binding protein